MILLIPLQKGYYEHVYNSHDIGLSEWYTEFGPISLNWNEFSDICNELLYFLHLFLQFKIKNLKFTIYYSISNIVFHFKEKNPTIL